MALLVNKDTTCNEREVQKVDETQDQPTTISRGECSTANREKEGQTRHYNIEDRRVEKELWVNVR